MIIRILIFYFICGVVQLNAQELIYDWHFTAQGADEDQLLNSIKDQKGNSILIGNFEDDLKVGDTDYMAEDFAKNGLMIKLDPNGAVLWSKEFRADAFDDIFPFDAAIDESNNIFLAGSIYGRVDVDPSEEEFILDSGDKDDIYFSKFDEAGNMMYATRIRVGPGFEERVLDMEIDEEGVIYCGGYIDISENGNKDDIFLFQVFPGDTAIELGWNYYIPSEGRLDGINEITVCEDYIYATGTFTGSVDFDPGEPEIILDSGDGEDIFVVKLSKTGEVVWAINMGAESEGDDCVGNSIRCDVEGNVYVAGEYDGMVDFDPGSGTAQLDGFLQSFLVKLSPDGDFQWVWDQDDLFAKQVLINSSNDPFIASEADGFVKIRKLNQDGQLNWVSQLNAQSLFSLSLRGIHFDADESIYVTANFSDEFEYDPNTGASVKAFDDDNDLIYVKLNQDPATPTRLFAPDQVLNVFPNPVVDRVNLLFEERQEQVDVQINDIQGKVLYQNTYEQVDQVALPFPYPNGNYYLTYKTSEGVQAVVKLVKGE